MKKLLFKRGFTDKLYYYNFCAVWRFVFVCFILNALSGLLQISDLPIITYGVPAAFAELGLHTAFIIWKAKVENCRKNKDYSKLHELEVLEL